MSTIYEIFSYTEFADTILELETEHEAISAPGDPPDLENLKLESDEADRGTPLSDPDFPPLIHKIYQFHVIGALLASFSPVWARSFGLKGGYKPPPTKIIDGREMKVLKIQDVHYKGLNFLFNLLHHHPVHTASLTYRELLEILVVGDKYQCMEYIMPKIEEVANRLLSDLVGKFDLCGNEDTLFLKRFFPANSCLQDAEPITCTRIMREISEVDEESMVFRRVVTESYPEPEECFYYGSSKWRKKRFQNHMLIDLPWKLTERVETIDYTLISESIMRTIIDKRRTALHEVQRLMNDFCYIMLTAEPFVNKSCCLLDNDLIAAFEKIWEMCQSIFCLPQSVLSFVKSLKENGLEWLAERNLQPHEDISLRELCGRIVDLRMTSAIFPDPGPAYHEHHRLQNEDGSDSDLMHYDAVEGKKGRRQIPDHNTANDIFDQEKGVRVCPLLRKLWQMQKDVVKIFNEACFPGVEVPYNSSRFYRKGEWEQHDEKYLGRKFYTGLGTDYNLDD